MADLITSNAVVSLYENPPPENGEDFRPVLQVLGVKKINTAAVGNGDRYRLILSDSKHYLQSMLTTQLNHYIDSKSIDKNTLLRLTGWTASALSGRRLIIIFSAEPIPAEQVGGPLEKIGTPIAIEAPPAGAGAAVATAAPAAQAQQQKPQLQSKPAVTAAQKPVQRVGAGRAGGGGGGNQPAGPLYPIEGLSPYQNKWTIKARVTHRSEIKHYSNQRGEGKLFNVTLMDDTGEIRATGFNDAVDNFYELLAEGKVFFISRAKINIAKKQYSNVNNEYEIMFENHTEIEPCNDESVPQVKYNFTQIKDLENCQKDQTTDVLAIVKEVHELGSIMSKSSQKPFSKRDILLVDQSQQSVRLTLWGKQAENFTSQGSPIIAFKGVKVGDFGGRSLSMFSSSTMTVEPDIAEAHSLRGWFDAEGGKATFNAFSNTGMTGAGAGAGAIRPEEVKTLGQVKDENIGTTDKQEYFTTKATINFVKHETFSYPACPTPQCNKKVTEDGSGWRCEKCEQSFPAPSHRYILNLNIMDHTGHIWITAFNEVAEVLLGIDANSLVELKDQDENAFSAIFTKAQARAMHFSCSAKQDTFNDTPRIRYNVRKAQGIDYKAESLNLARMIEAM